MQFHISAIGPSGYTVGRVDTLILKVYSDGTITIFEDGSTGQKVLEVHDCSVAQLAAIGKLVKLYEEWVEYHQ